MVKRRASLGESWLCFSRLGLSLSTGRFGAGSMLEVTFKRNAQRPPLYAATLEREETHLPLPAHEVIPNHAKDGMGSWKKEKCAGSNYRVD